MSELEESLGELSEAQCRLSDRLNLLFDEELPGRRFTSLDSAYIQRILEHVLIAYDLADALGKRVTRNE